MSSNFDFLNEDLPRLKILGEEIEDKLFKYVQDAVASSRIFCEEISKEIATEEGLEDLLALSQNDRIKELQKEQLIPQDMVNKLHEVRKAGNAAVHSTGYEDYSEALKVHRNLYDIAKWYIEVYGSDINLVIPDYWNPMKDVQNKFGGKSEEVIIQQIVEKTLAIHDKIVEKEPVVRAIENKAMGQTTEEAEKLEEPEEPVVLEKGNQEKEKAKVQVKDDEKKSLLYVLESLSDSSKEAVIGTNQFNDFKKYMHIERPIQKDLEKRLENEAAKEGASLVFVCGNVGDGKSHVISFLKEKRRDLLDRFDIHNDATESFDPKKDAMETLDEVLKDFSDERIGSSNKKMILAINLGILNNWLESDYISQYKGLVDYIKETGLFDHGNKGDIKNPYFSLLNFGGHHLYELEEDGLHSPYVRTFLDKLTKEDESNPFYQGYILDKQKNKKALYMRNYEAMKNPVLKKYIHDLLGRVSIENKTNISPRMLMDFFYNVLVPENDFSVSEEIGLEDYTGGMVENRLFTLAGKSKLLELVAAQDPCNQRNQTMDRLIVELVNAPVVAEVFRKYLKVESLGEWIEGIKEEEFSSKGTNDLIRPFIHMVYIYAKEFMKESPESLFEDYLSYLYAFNWIEEEAIERMHENVKQTVKSWNGTLKDNLYYEQDFNEELRLAYHIEIHADYSAFRKNDNDDHSIYTNYLRVAFKNLKEESVHKLDIDFLLFKMINKVLHGYRPNKLDRQEAIKLDEFIQEMVVKDSDKKEIYFHMPTNRLDFRLKIKEGFGKDEFVFERLDDIG